MPLEYNPDWLNQTPPPEGQVFDPDTMTPPPEEAPNPPGVARATGEMFGPPMPAPEMGQPGTMTIQRAGQAPVTTRVRQIAPQPLPWWMAQQDEELRNQRIQEQARQEAQMQTNQAYVRAKQLEGQLGFAADIQAGVPMPTALAKWMPKIHAGNPASYGKALNTAIPQMSRFARPDFSPTETSVGGTRMLQVTPGRFVVAPGQSTKAPSTFEPRSMTLPGGGTMIERSPGMWINAPRQPAPREEAKSVSVSIPDPTGKFSVGTRRMTEAQFAADQASQELADLQAKLEKAKSSHFTRQSTVDDLQKQVDDKSKELQELQRPADTEKVTTKAQYDALPSGTTYIGKDGRRYRKP